MNVRGQCLLSRNVLASWAENDADADNNVANNIGVSLNKA